MAVALAEDDRSNESGRAGVDVHDGTTGEVEDTALELQGVVRNDDPSSGGSTHHKLRSARRMRAISKHATGRHAP